MATGTIESPRELVFGKSFNPVYKNTSYTNLNTLATNEFDGSGKQFVMLDNAATIDGCGWCNRNIILGWLNAAKTYGYLVVIGFGGIYYAFRNNASSFTIRTVASA